MITQDALTGYLQHFLQVEKFKDYCPNGLQVAGKKNISTIVTGVTACQDLINAAVSRQADAILVHHGYFWKGEDPCITGIKKQRIHALLTKNISLYAYHLPLDAHLEIGNNIELANVLGIEGASPIIENGQTSLVFHGELANEMSCEVFATHLTTCLNRPPLHIAAKPKTIKRIAWCTGAAQDYIELAAAAGADAYISGEISERTTHLAKEMDIHYFSAGHHATERYGIRALGEHLAQAFGVLHHYIDIPNPV